MSDSLWPHGLQHARLPCLSPIPKAYSCPLSWWYYPAIYLILCHPFLFLPSIFPNIRVFSNESVLHIRWPNYWSFSFSISPSNEYSGLISFRIDGCESLAVQGTLKSLLQTIVWKHQFLSTQTSLWPNSHINTWLQEKTIALTIWTLVGKVMSLLFNILSSFVIGEGNGNPLQYSCLENPMDGGACRLQSMGSQRVGHDWATSLSHSLDIDRLARPEVWTWSCDR